MKLPEIFALKHFVGTTPYHIKINSIYVCIFVRIVEQHYYNNDYDHCTHSTDSSIEAWVGPSGWWSTGIITTLTVLPTTLRDTRTCIASTLSLHVYNSYYLTVIGVHEMHSILLVVDLYSSLAYFMMTHPLPIAGKLPIKTLVARQLPTNNDYYSDYDGSDFCVVIKTIHTG